MLALMLACAPGVLEVRPAVGSARGGDEVCVRGRRFTDDAQVFFDGQRAVVTERRRGELWVRTPPGIAGEATVSVQGRGDREGELEGGFTYEALELDYRQAAPHYLPTPEVELVDAVAGDLDGDGVSEVFVLDVEGVVHRWDNTGHGAFVSGQAPEIGGVVRGLSIVETADASALFVCHGDGESSRVFRGSELPGAPLDARACQTARDLGGGVVAELGSDGARLWSDLARWPDAQPQDLDSCGVLSADEGLEVACPIEDGVGRLAAVGEGTVSLTLSLPAIARADDGLRLDLDGDWPQLTVVDDAGVSFTTPGGERTDPVATWGEVEPTLPLRSLTLTWDSPRALEVELDRIVLELQDGGRALVQDFEAWPVEAAGDAVDAVVIGDGLVLGGPSGLTLLDPVSGGYRAALQGTLPDVGCDVGGLAAADADGDGVDELAVACAGQDRLYRQDGGTHWFEDSVASLPVDATDGADVLAADLDRDGLDDLVIANPGSLDRLYHSDGARYEDWTPQLSLETGTTLRALALDVDGDVDLDLILVGPDGARLFVLY